MEEIFRKIDKANAKTMKKNVKKQPTSKMKRQQGKGMDQSTTTMTKQNCP
jgi:hypothetical protein